MRRAFEAGSVNLEEPNAYFIREKEQSVVQAALTPSTFSRSFLLVTGEHGTGKSTLVRHCCRTIGSGVLYFEVPIDPAELPHTLGERVSFDWDTHISFWSQLRRRVFTGESSRKPPAELNTILQAISEASNRYKQKHKKAPVLVIDNLTVLAKKDGQTFEKLVQFAKKEADAGRLLVAFVASEGHTPRQMLGISESSRLGDIIEIGDLSEEETHRYLDFLQVKFDKTKMYDLAGGRPVLLNAIVQNLNRGKIYEDIRKDMMNRAQKEFIASKILPLRTAEQNRLWREVIFPLAELQNMAYYDFVVKTNQPDLLDGNVFAYHLSTDTVSFQSRPVELFVEEAIKYNLVNYTMDE